MAEQRKGPVLFLLSDVEQAKALTDQLMTETFWHDARVLDSRLTFQRRQDGNFIIEGGIDYLLAARMGIAESPSILVLSADVTFDPKELKEYYGEGRPMGAMQAEMAAYLEREQRKALEVDALQPSEHAGFIARRVNEDLGNTAIYLLGKQPEKTEGITQVFVDDESGRVAMLDAIRNYINAPTVTPLSDLGAHHKSQNRPERGQGNA